MHEVRRLIPKMGEIFTNKLRYVSASTIERAKYCLVKYTILQRIVLSARLKIRKIVINMFLHSRLFGKPSEA